jgi:hypothetical protein
MEMENIILSEVRQGQKVKIVCSPSHADYRPKTSAVILLHIGQRLRGKCIQEE